MNEVSYIVDTTLQLQECFGIRILMSNLRPPPHENYIYAIDPMRYTGCNFFHGRLRHVTFFMCEN